MTDVMSVENFLAYARSGRAFSVEFVKRTTGEVRRMQARCGVKAHLAGGAPAYDFAEKKLVPVWDFNKEDYRCIPLDSIIWVKLKGLHWDWDNDLNSFVARI